MKREKKAVIFFLPFSFFGKEERLRAVASFLVPPPPFRALVSSL